MSNLCVTRGDPIFNGMKEWIKKFKLKAKTNFELLNVEKEIC